MRRMVLLLLFLSLCIIFAGCGRLSKVLDAAAGGLSVSPSPTLATLEPATTQAPSTAASPTESPAPTHPPVSEYYPLERIPLPAGSEVFKWENNFDDQMAFESYHETTALKLAMTKTEAIAYFEPLLKKGVELYDTAGYGDVPQEILAAYPDVAAQTELYARYDDKTDNIEIIKVLLYTLEDEETLVAATIVVYYRQSPAKSAAANPAQEKTPAVSNAPAGAEITGNWSYIDDSEALKKQTYYIFKEDGAYLQFDISIVTEQYLSVTAYRGKYEISGDKLLLTGREKTAYSTASIGDVIKQAEEMIYTPGEDLEEDFAWGGADRLLIGGVELTREQ